MERQPINSSSLASVGYDPSSETLEIEFIGSGRVYEYYNFPSFMYERLLEAPSAGAFFNTEIKDMYVCNPV